MFCAPTSAVNWMAYIANHGYPQVSPGPGNWQGQEVYNEVSDTIRLMGEAMSTIPNTGTGGDGIVAGLEAWLAPHGNKFVVIRRVRHEEFCPRLGDMAAAALSGQVVMTSIGWYHEHIARDSGLFLFREGGHIVSMVKAHAAGEPVVYTLGWRNPGKGDSSRTSQSPFSTGITTLTPTTATFDNFPRTCDKVDGYSRGYLDGFNAICPVFGLTTGVDDLSLGTINPVPLAPINKPLNVSFPSPSGDPHPLRVAAPHADGRHAGDPGGRRRSQSALEAGFRNRTGDGRSATRRT